MFQKYHNKHYILIGATIVCNNYKGEKRKMTEIESKKIKGRIFNVVFKGSTDYEPEIVYEYKGHKIAQKWIVSGWETRWGEYRETDVRRWLVDGNENEPFSSITKAAESIDKKTRY